MASKVDDVRNCKGRWIKSYTIDRVSYQTASYVLWSNMKSRTKVGGSYQRGEASYIGCTVSKNFSDFQYFAEWHTKQIGYCVKGYALEKDILIEGNKCYGEDTCVLVPAELNNFLTSNTARRGIYPQGVSFNKSAGKFAAQIRVDNKSMHIGCYETPEEARAVYEVFKEAEAYRWYERLKAGEYLVDERVIERMRTWILPN
jgi:hypothetical protein